MPLPVSGPISMSDVNVELGRSATAQISMGDANVRGLFGVASGPISKLNGRGKSSQFAFSITSNQTNADLRTLAINAGWSGSGKLVATINSGVYISSTSTGTPAMTVNGSFPGGVELINNGFIIGRGGNGGAGAGWYDDCGPRALAGGGGGGGGTAISASVAISVRNNGTIAGGGGGGGGGQMGSRNLSGTKYFTGGGGGGGRSNPAGNSSGGGAGGGYGAMNSVAAGGGAGTASVNGGGGQGSWWRTDDGYGNFTYYRGGAGGAGGGWGAAGAAGGGVSNIGGGPFGPYGGGSGGAAVSGNGNITWLATGTRLGAIA